MSELDMTVDDHIRLGRRLYELDVALAEQWVRFRKVPGYTNDLAPMITGLNAVRAGLDGQFFADHAGSYAESVYYPGSVSSTQVRADVRKAQRTDEEAA